MAWWDWPKWRIPLPKSIKRKCLRTSPATPESIPSFSFHIEVRDVKPPTEVETQSCTGYTTAVIRSPKFKAVFDPAATNNMISRETVEILLQDETYRQYSCEEICLEWVVVDCPQRCRTTHQITERKDVKTIVFSRNKRTNDSADQLSALEKFLVSLNSHNPSLVRSQSEGTKVFGQSSRYRRSTWPISKHIKRHKSGLASVPAYPRLASDILVFGDCVWEENEKWEVVDWLPWSACNGTNLKNGLMLQQPQNDSVFNATLNEASHDATPRGASELSPDILAPEESQFPPADRLDDINTNDQNSIGTHDWNVDTRSSKKTTALSSDESFRSDIRPTATIQTTIINKSPRGDDESSTLKGFFVQEPLPSTPGSSPAQFHSGPSGPRGSTSHGLSDIKKGKQSSSLQSSGEPPSLENTSTGRQSPNSHSQLGSDNMLSTRLTSVMDFVTTSLDMTAADQMQASTSMSRDEAKKTPTNVSPYTDTDSDSSSSMFPDDYWVYDKSEKNYYHDDVGPDQKKARVWYPEKFLKGATARPGKHKCG
ncbi:hypothetical protein F5Y16DRAFT_378 [Xylariaceae sp. FL0255]|nr:hypothetical protein F5Y16DRAFT_378 [Xylariaceae sp. FL0255]